MKRLIVMLCLLLACATLFCSCGNSIVSAAVNNDGHLILTMDDGTTMDAGNVKGAQGEKGETGAQGPQGEKGEKDDAAADENPQELDFYPLPDGTYAVSAGKAIYLEEITIPATYRGKAVTCVGLPKDVDDDLGECNGLFGFLMAPYLKKVTLPDTITYIGEMAFKECQNLTQINLPDSLLGIGEDAFEYCTSLASIEIPTSVTSIGYEAFEYCTSLTSITIPASATFIGDNAFYGCTSLTSVTFAETSGWVATHYMEENDKIAISSADLANKSTAATYLRSTYYDYYWNRTVE